jgi:hypothetical protein
MLENYKITCCWNNIIIQRLEVGVLFNLLLLLLLCFSYISSLSKQAKQFTINQSALTKTNTALPQKRALIFPSFKSNKNNLYSNDNDRNTTTLHTMQQYRM